MPVCLGVTLSEHYEWTEHDSMKTGPCKRLLAVVVDIDKCSESERKLDLFSTNAILFERSRTLQ